jgi:hypothetical protein
VSCISDSHYQNTFFPVTYRPVHHRRYAWRTFYASANDDLDPAILRLAYTGTRRDEQMRLTEAPYGNGLAWHAVAHQFPRNGVGPPNRECLVILRRARSVRIAIN